MHNAMRINFDKAGPRVVEALERHRFEAYYCATVAEAAEKVMELIPEDHVVSWGGTVTMEELGIMARLRAGERKVIDRDTAKTPEERNELMRQALLCDTFLMSSNAVSKDGQLVNVDGNGLSVFHSKDLSFTMLNVPEEVIVTSTSARVLRCTNVPVTVAGSAASMR